MQEPRQLSGQAERPAWLGGRPSKEEQGVDPLPRTAPCCRNADARRRPNDDQLIDVQHLEQGHRCSRRMVRRRLDPQRPGLQEPFGDPLRGHPDPIRQHRRCTGGRLTDVGSLGNGQHHSPGDKACVVVPVPKAVASHRRADLSLQGVVGLPAPPAKHVADGARPLGTRRGIQVVPGPSDSGHHAHEHQGS